MSLLKIEIPNIFENPYVILLQEIGEETYYFEYYWNIRHDKLYLSIYLLDNDTKIYLVKSVLLLNDVEVSRYIINDRWSGGLFFTSDISVGTEYNIKSVSSDFYLLYNSEFLSKHE